MIRNGINLCLRCNTEDTVQTQIFLRDEDTAPEDVIIECPGVTLFGPDGDEIIAGVEFLDNDDTATGYRIVDHPVFAPDHTRQRRIKAQALGRIRRCRACQDYTIRMRRREGRDFCIPSPKHPRRKKLKAMTHLTYEPSE